MVNFTNMILIVFFGFLGYDNRNNLECVTEKGQIFSLTTDGKRSNVNEACTSIQIRVFGTAAYGRADET